MTITICLGSSCHISGSRHIINEMEQLVWDYKLGDRIEMHGKFCSKKCCCGGVCVTVDDKPFTLKAEEVKDFFKEEVVKKLWVNACLNI